MCADWSVITSRRAEYYAAVLIVGGLVMGVWCTTDALLFYFFWEAMLIPMFLKIGIWGGARRVGRVSGIAASYPGKGRSRWPWPSTTGRKPRQRLPGLRPSRHPTRLQII